MDCWLDKMRHLVTSAFAVGYRKQLLFSDVLINWKITGRLIDKVNSL